MQFLWIVFWSVENVLLALYVKGKMKCIVLGKGVDLLDCVVCCIVFSWNGFAYLRVNFRRQQQQLPLCNCDLNWHGTVIHVHHNLVVIYWRESVIGWLWLLADRWLKYSCIVVILWYHVAGVLCIGEWVLQFFVIGGGDDSLWFLYCLQCWWVTALAFGLLVICVSFWCGNILCFLPSSAASRTGLSLMQGEELALKAVYTLLYR